MTGGRPRLLPGPLRPRLRRLPGQLRRLLRRARRPFGASSLRRQIAFTIAAVAFAVAVVLGVLVHNTVARQNIDEARAKASDRLDEVLTDYSFGRFRVASSSDVVLDPADLPSQLRTLVVQKGRRGTAVGTHNGLPVMWAASRADHRVLAVWQDYSGTRRKVAGLDRTIALSAALAAAVIALAGIVVATRISRRLHITAQVARRISAGDLDARVGRFGRRDEAAGERAGEPTKDEVEAVAAALDSMAAAVQDRIRAEQRFTADVAHELRTPLTGLLASAGLLPEGRPKEMIIDRLQALRRLTEDLLEISRLDARVEHADLASHRLGPLIERAVRVTGLEARVRVAEDAVVATDRRRLERIVANLVVNSHRHGRPPVTVTVEGPRVTVRDHGGGYPPDLLAHGPQRFRTEAPGRGKGHGLGLTIADGQAAVIGARLLFSNAPDGGAVATVVLPTAGAGEPPS